jgi:putative transposase
MVRAGVVNHPKDWETCGYHELQKPKERHSLIDCEGLSRALGFHDVGAFREQHRALVEQAITSDELERDETWSKSIAVGSPAFISNVTNKLGLKVRSRKVIQVEDKTILREPLFSYNANFAPKNEVLID